MLMRVGKSFCDVGCNRLLRRASSISGAKSKTSLPNESQRTRSTFACSSGLVTALPLGVDRREKRRARVVAARINVRAENIDWNDREGTCDFGEQLSPVPSAKGNNAVALFGKRFPFYSGRERRTIRREYVSQKNRGTNAGAKQFVPP